MQAIHVQSTDDVSCRTSRADVFAEQREAGDVTVAHSSVQLTNQTAHRTAGVLGRSSDPERRAAWPTGGANPRSLFHKEKLHIVRCGASRCPTLSGPREVMNVHPSVQLTHHRGSGKGPPSGTNHVPPFEPM